jgi:hypothetical protein
MTKTSPAMRPANHTRRVECGKTEIPMTKSQDAAAAGPPIDSRKRQNRAFHDQEAGR